MKHYSILDRYILNELFPPFLFGVAAFAGIFIAADLVYLARVAVSVGAPFLTAVELSLMKFPQMLTFTLPMATLMGVLLALGKLSQSSEIIAIQACGQGFWRTIRPAIIFGFIVTLFGLFVNDVLAPAASYRYEKLFYQMVNNNPLPRIKQNLILPDYEGGKLKNIIYAEKFDSDSLTFYNVSYFEYDNGKPKTTTQAEKMIWTDEAWYLEEGQTINHGASTTTEITFSRSIQPVPTRYKPNDIIVIDKKPEQMGIRELKHHINLYQGQGEKLRKLEIDWHQKIAIPFASIIFALLGAALAVSSPRSGSARGFGLSIAIVFIYYVLLTLSSVLGEGGSLPPLLAAWTQNIIVGTWGIWLAIKRGR